MITTEIKINGILLGHMYAHNVGKANDGFGNDRGRYRYDYEYYRIGKGRIIMGSLTHNRSEGAEKLISLLLDEVKE